MKFAVDPWNPAYGTSVDTEPDEPAAEVRLDVELPVGQWRPVDPDPSAAVPSAVRFVDGVRRVDAQVWVDDDPEPSPALCASYAAGVVCSCPEEGAHLLKGEVRRGLFTTAESAGPIETVAGPYSVTRTAVRENRAPAQVLSQAVQLELNRTELTVAEVARTEHELGDDLLVVDGPLRGREHLPRIIGFVKTHRAAYLPAPLRGVVAELATGQRTPVFRVGSTYERYERHTWYLRLPGGQGGPWAGVVRVECGADLTADAAVALAHGSQVALPRYASTEYKDSRAPQNLYPIAGLERELRRRLGEPNLLYRALRRAAAASARPRSLISV